MDGESSGGCCGCIGSCGDCGSFLPLPGLEDEVEKDHDDDETEGEDVDEQMPVHLGGLRVLGVGQGAGQVGGTGETGTGFAHSRNSTGVPVGLQCSFHSC